MLRSYFAKADYPPRQHRHFRHKVVSCQTHFMIFKNLISIKVSCPCQYLRILAKLLLLLELHSPLKQWSFKVHLHCQFTFFLVTICKIFEWQEKDKFSSHLIFLLISYHREWNWNVTVVSWLFFLLAVDTDNTFTGLHLHCAMLFWREDVKVCSCFVVGGDGMMSLLFLMMPVDLL